MPPLLTRLRRRLQRLARRRDAPPERDLPPLACLHCRGDLPGTADDNAIAVFAACPASGRRLRASADRRSRAVHIDLDTEQGPRHVATVEGFDTARVRVRIWEQLHVPLRLRRDLPAIAAYVWDLADSTATEQRSSRTDRPRGDRAAARMIRDGEGVGSSRTDRPRGDLAAAAAAFTGPGRDASITGGVDPLLDAALAQINTEIDYWIGLCASQESLRDPAVTCSLMATVLTDALTDDRASVVALAAGALTRLAHPPERHNLPPDPETETDTGERR